MAELDIFGLKPHPAADAFPMMEEEELEELAQDIRANGLQQPLVINKLDGAPCLVDGRNRREACRRAGVIPDYVLLDGQDPVAYIVSANINRRHISKGQRAMLIALLYPEGGRGKTPSFLEFSGERLRQARFVLRHASDLLDSVRNGSISLDNAYDEARIRKGRADTHESRFNALKVSAPDLAEMVVEGQLNLEEAEAAEREREERARRRTKLIVEALHALSAHAYLINKTSHDEVVRIITQEAALYQQHNCGPVDEFIEALAIFREHAGVLLNKLTLLEVAHVEEG